MTYNIEIRDRERVVIVTGSSGREIFRQTITQQEGSTDLNEAWFNSLSNSQQDTLKAFLQESSPIHNLLLADADDNIIIGDFLFVNNKNLIARALVEILYQLRNALFHGEITPTSQIQKTYEPAYLILKRIILLVTNTSTDQNK